MLCMLSRRPLARGFLPVRIAFLVIAYALKSIATYIPDSIIIESFLDFLSAYEADVLKQALSQEQFSPEMVDKLVALLSGFGCKEIPSPSKLKMRILQVAKHEMLNVPLRAVHLMNSDVPFRHKSFWDDVSLVELFKLYKCMVATLSRVLSLIIKPSGMNAAEQRVYGYLCSFVEHSN